MDVSAGESDLLQLAHGHEQTAAVERNRAHGNMAVSQHVDCFKLLLLIGVTSREVFRFARIWPNLTRYLTKEEGPDARCALPLLIRSLVRATLCHPRLGPC